MVVTQRLVLVLASKVIRADVWRKNDESDVCCLSQEHNFHQTYGIVYMCIECISGCYVPYHQKAQFINVWRFGAINMYQLRFAISKFVRNYSHYRRHKKIKKTIKSPQWFLHSILHRFNFASPGLKTRFENNIDSQLDTFHFSYFLSYTSFHLHVLVYMRYTFDIGPLRTMYSAYRSTYVIHWMHRQNHVLTTFLIDVRNVVDTTSW